MLAQFAGAMLHYIDGIRIDRGVPYVPVGLLVEYTLAWPSIERAGGSTYNSYRLSYDHADHMNHGVLCELLFPKHPTGTAGETDSGYVALAFLAVLVLAIRAATTACTAVSSAVLRLSGPIGGQ